MNLTNPQPSKAEGSANRRRPPRNSMAEGRVPLPRPGVGRHCNSWTRWPIAAKLTRALANGSDRVHFGSRQAAAANGSQAQNGRPLLSVTFGAASAEILTSTRTNSSSSCHVGWPITRRNSGALWRSTVVRRRPDQQATILKAVC